MALFTVVACSAAPVEPHRVVAPPVALPAPDAAIPHVRAGRGGACGAVGRLAECADGLTCLPLPAGYCGSTCDDGACDGACTEMRSGRMCMQPCTHDTDCRAADGYRCDAQWHACALPGSTAIVPRQCPRVGGERDAAFGDGEPASDAHALARRAGELVVWRDGGAIELARGSAAPLAIHEPADAPGSPLVAVGPDPHKRGSELVYVLAGAHGLGMRVLASRDGGATFAPAVTAMTGTYGNAAVGSDGKLHVVAIDGDALGGWGSAMQTILYATSSDGGATFAKPIVVSGRDEVLPYYFANPSIAVDGKRKLVYVAYVRGGRDGVWDIVVAATRDGGAKWTRTTIGDGCAIHMVPNLAVDPTTGTLHVAYYDNAGAPGRFVHATCASGAATCTAWGAIATFDALSTMPGALGDHASLVVDDKQRTLDAVWTQPGARVVHATAKLRR